jgi:hypothetical protein
LINIKNHEKAIKVIKYGIWLYFFLLIFEGALRKWFLPALATPLLVVRDPIALYLVLRTWYIGKLPANGYMTGMVLIGIVGVFTATLLGHGNLYVALYGARILLIHFPFIFVISSIFNKDDVIKIGKAILWISIPMAILITLQFYSPQTAWVNRGVGGSTEGAGFAGAMGYFRPPATFSFTIGTHLFFGLVGSFLFYFWLNPKGLSKIMLIGSTIGLLAAIPFSISRSLTFHVALTLAFMAVAILQEPKYIMKMVLISIIVLIALASLYNTSFFQTATMAFTSRFETANEIEGGLEGVLIDRFLGGMVGALTKTGEQPFFGYGIGMGTNVGSMLLAGKLVYLIDEAEWGRLIGEMGPLLGLGIILIRVFLDAKLSFESYRTMLKGNILPWMLLSYGILLIAQSQWASPTALGFSIFITGIIIAAFKEVKPYPVK